MRQGRISAGVDTDEEDIDEILDNRARRHGCLVRGYDTDAARHDVASGALEAVYHGQYGPPYTSDDVFDETITVTERLTGSHLAATQRSDRLQGRDQYPRVFDLLHVTTAVFADAITVFERHDDQGLSFTDASSVALVDRHDLDGLLRFHSDFDGVVHRFDPEGV